MDERVPPLNPEEEAELDDAVHEMGFSVRFFPHFLNLILLERPAQ